MTQDADSLQPGEIVRVVDADDEPKVMVLEVYEAQQDEKQVDWDFNQDPVYVYDYDENKSYDPGARVVGVVYLGPLKGREEVDSWATVSPETVRELVETTTLKEYHFPAPRLESVEMEGIAYQ